MTDDLHKPETVLVGYSIQDLLSRLEGKIDLMAGKLDANHDAHSQRIQALERRPPPIDNGIHRMLFVEDRVERLDGRMERIEAQALQTAGAALFKDRAFGRTAVYVGIFAAVAGTVLSVVNAWL